MKYKSYKILDLSTGEYVKHMSCFTNTIKESIYPGKLAARDYIKYHIKIEASFAKAVAHYSDQVYFYTKTVKEQFELIEVNEEPNV